MATKYTRENENDEEREARRTPWIRQGPIARPMSRRQRLFVLLAGFTAVILLAQVALKLNRGAPYSFQSVQRGAGTIVAKGELDPGASPPVSGAVTIEVALGESRVMTGQGRIPEPYWRKLEIGDRVAVLYQIHKLGQEIRIMECGVVALSDNIR